MSNAKDILIPALKLCRDQYNMCYTNSVYVFLLIAEHPGHSPSDIAKLVNLSLSTTSRIIGTLSTFPQKQGTGLDLVTAQVSPKERRRKNLYLTDKGKKLFKEIQELNKAPLLQEADAI